MNKLWAPWRMAYITQRKTPGCIFCKIRNSRKDKKNFVLYRSRLSFALLNTYPYNNGHLMVVTKRHVNSLEKLNPGEIMDLFTSTQKMIQLLKKVLRPDGFNIGLNMGTLAGAGIESHLHVHIVPRWQGDTNYMPVVANTKIISQSLVELYSRAKRCLREKK